MYNVFFFKKNSEFIVEESTLLKSAYYLRLKVKLYTDLLWIPYLLCVDIIKTGVQGKIIILR